jgi:hypothetical protein
MKDSGRHIVFVPFGWLTKKVALKLAPAAVLCSKETKEQLRFIYIVNIFHKYFKVENSLVV